jgi:hypothetical protein
MSLTQTLAASRSAGVGLCSSHFCVGGVMVGLTGDDSAAVELVPSLMAFRAEPGLPDIQVRVEWTDELTPASGLQLFDSGALWRLYECEAGFQFDFRAPVFGDEPYKRLLVNRDFSRATLQMSAEVSGAFPYAAPLDYPVDELLIMHRLTQEEAIELHGCGIVRADGTGNLFVGHSGAGKSTTTRLWMEREHVEILSDDRIIVRRDEGPRDCGSSFEDCGGTSGCEGEVGILRLRDCSASRDSRFAQDDRTKTKCFARGGELEKQVPPLRFANGRNDKVFMRNDKPSTRNYNASIRNDKSNMRMYGTPWHGEAAYGSPGSARLGSIFVLEHGAGNVLTRLSASQAVAELFARSFVPFHRHEYVESALEFLQELVSAVPCYRYAFEPDGGAVERVLELCD